MLEFAFILPCLVGIVLGTIDVSLAFHQKLAVNRASREGARIASTVEKGNCAAIKTRAVEATKSALNRNGALFASDNMDVQTEIVDVSDLDLDEVGFNATFIKVTVSNQFKCFFCQWLNPQREVNAVAMSRLENPWLCSPTPPFYEYGL